MALLVGGVALIVLELVYKEQKHHAESIEKISLGKAFGIGLFQSLSVIPGVSRAAASIIGGLFMGAKRTVAVEFSFFLAIPTIFAATALDLKESNLQFSSNELFVAFVGFIVSFFVALVTVRYFLKFIKRNNFIGFGVYRIILAIAYYLLLLK